MPTIGTSIDISGLVDATVAGDSDRIITAARRLLQQGAPAAELAGRLGLIAAHGDSDGHAILTLNAAGAISRWVSALPPLADQDPQSHTSASCLASMGQARIIVQWRCVHMMALLRPSRTRGTR